MSKLKTFTGIACACAMIAGCDGAQEADTNQASASSSEHLFAPNEAIPTEANLYRVRLRPEALPIVVGQMHRWIVSVEDAIGKPLPGAAVQFDATMPHHGHGLPTEPKAVPAGVAGDFRVDGVKFHMGGRWTLKVRVIGPAGVDELTTFVDL